MIADTLAPRTALWLVPVADLGGVARHVVDALTTGIPGWRTVLLCPQGPLAERARAAGLAVVTGPVSPADGIPTGVAEVRRTIGTLRPAVVHSHLAYADLLAAAAGVGSSVRLVTTEHGIADDDLVYHGTPWRSRLRALAHTVRLRRADALIAVSRSTADVVRRKWHPAASLHSAVVLNGVDPVIDRPERGPGLHVISLARHAPEKGLTDLLEAFALVAAQDGSARLTMAGDGPLRSELIARSRELGLSDRVAFPGHVDPGPVLAQADVLAQLSVWENCSYTILDALAHGLGVVATPVGGNPEILPPSALIPRIEHEAVARALLRQGRDPASRPQLPADWPTMGAMSASIAEVYEVVMR